MPARSIATRTASATLVIIATRPMSSGSSTSLIAKPTVSRGSSVARRAAGRQRREHGGVRRQHPVGAAGPDDRDLPDLLGGAGALGGDHLAERPVGDDPGVVVDAAVALGLADHRDDPIGVEHPGVDQRGQLAGVGHAVQRDLADLDRLGHWDLLLDAAAGDRTDRRVGTDAVHCTDGTQRPTRQVRSAGTVGRGTSACRRPALRRQSDQDVSSLTNTGRTMSAHPSGNVFGRPTAIL